MEKQHHALTTSPSNLASSLDDDYTYSISINSLPWVVAIEPAKHTCDWHSMQGMK